MAGLKTPAFFVDPDGIDDVRDIDGLKLFLKDYLKDNAHRGNTLKRDYENVDLEATVTRIVRNGGGSGGGGGGTTVVIGFASSFAASAGSNTVPIPSDMRTGTVDYIVSAVLVNDTFGAQTLGQPDTKNTNSFTFNDLAIAGTLYFSIQKRP